MGKFDAHRPPPPPDDQGPGKADSDADLLRALGLSGVTIVVREDVPDTLGPNLGAYRETAAPEAKKIVTNDDIIELLISRARDQLLPSYRKTDWFQPFAHWQFKEVGDFGGVTREEDSYVTNILTSFAKDLLNLNSSPNILQAHDRMGALDKSSHTIRMWGILLHGNPQDLSSQAGIFIVSVQHDSEFLFPKLNGSTADSDGKPVPSYKSERQTEPVLIAFMARLLPSLQAWEDPKLHIFPESVKLFA